jgi:hypothetical protein
MAITTQQGNMQMSTEERQQLRKKDLINQFLRIGDYENVPTQASLTVDLHVELDRILSTPNREARLEAIEDWTIMDLIKRVAYSTMEKERRANMFEC